MIDRIPSVRAFLAGNSGSGKTTRAYDLYLKRIPRRIVIDATGEWAEKGLADVDAITLDQCVSAVRQLAPRGAWTVSYANADNRFTELVRWLVPVPYLDESPAVIVGGMALLCDEVDLLAPFGPPTEAIRNLYRRSRHCGLSVISCTQRPSNVSKEVTSQSTHRLALFLDEPNDIAYMQDAMRWNLATLQQYYRWTKAHPHGAVWRETLTGRQLWLP